jgi:hypothetical protein
MINVWDYAPCDRARIVFHDGEVLEGSLTSIDDEEDSGLGECGVSIFTDDGRYIGVGQSEIESIEVLEAKA